jgi:hypothetical protein
MNKVIIRRPAFWLTAATMSLAMTSLAAAAVHAQADSSSTTTDTAVVNSSTVVNDSTSATSASSARTEGVLWTAPAYQVKPVGSKPRLFPPDVLPGDAFPPRGPTDIPNSRTPDATATPATSVSGDGLIENTKKRKTVTATETVIDHYDPAAVRAFSQAVGGTPQYVWLSAPKTTTVNQYQIKESKLLPTATTSAFDTYIKDLTKRVESNLSVPQSAQLVEMTNRKYKYLISFMVKSNGQISNITSEKQAGSITSEPLADDGENAQIVQALSRALTRSAPVKTPPSGFAPWYMVMQYDVNSGKLLLACLNAR